MMNAQQKKIALALNAEKYKLMDKFFFKNYLISEEIIHQLETQRF